MKDIKKPNKNLTLTLDPLKPLLSCRTIVERKSCELQEQILACSNEDENPLNLASLDEEPMDETLSPTLSYLTIPSDESEQGSNSPSPILECELLEPPQTRISSQLSH